MTNHERYRKELANKDVNYMCYFKYPHECQYHGSLKLTHEQMKEYITASDKDKYLRSINKTFSLED